MCLEEKLKNQEMQYCLKYLGCIPVIYNIYMNIYVYLYIVYKYMNIYMFIYIQNDLT